MSTPISETAVAKETKFTVFTPFGGKDEIKLSVQMVIDLICEPTKQGNKCSQRDAVKFIAMCLAKRLNPFEGDAFLVGYDSAQDGPKFSLITAHQAFLKRAELNKEYNGMKSGVIVVRDQVLIELEGDFHLDADTLVGGWACVYFKNREHPMFKRVKLSRFNTGRSIWAKDPAGMICKVAEADALRSSFPTMLGGLYMREEIEAEPKEEVLKAPIFKGSKKAIDIPSTTAIEEETQASKLRKLCVAEGISEFQLVSFMSTAGLADDGARTLADVELYSEKSIPAVITNWKEFSEKVKEAK